VERKRPDTLHIPLAESPKGSTKVFQSVLKMKRTQKTANP
jgi:hypothetical protein